MPHTVLTQPPVEEYAVSCNAMYVCVRQAQPFPEDKLAAMAEMLLRTVRFAHLVLMPWNSCLRFTEMTFQFSRVSQ